MPKTVEELEEFADKHYPEDSDRKVSLGLLRAWIFENHYHVKKTGIPVVQSIDLEIFIKENSE